MNILQLLLITLFFISSSRDIIKNLPYNIYQIEDMNQYETKFLPEGNKFYIRLPKNIQKETTFYLTIPKNISLFPIYSSEFRENPKDEEIINADYQNEIQLKNIENKEYSIYSFNIEKSDSYKILYFQNNEALNYLSFFASNLNETIPTYENLDADTNKNFNIDPLTTNYYKVQIDPDEEDIRISLRVYYLKGLASKIEFGYHFFNNPSDSDITNRSNYKDEQYKEDSNKYSEIREYKLENKNKYQYLGICIVNKVNAVQELYIFIHVSGLSGWAIALIVIASIIGLIIMIVFFAYLVEHNISCNL